VVWRSKGDGPVVVIVHEMVSRVLRYTYAGLSTEEALELPHPQDSVMVLSDGGLSKLRIRRYTVAYSTLRLMTGGRTYGNPRRLLLRSGSLPNHSAPSQCEELSLLTLQKGV